jgi:hypothetical protein
MSKPRAETLSTLRARLTEDMSISDLAFTVLRSRGHSRYEESELRSWIAIISERAEQQQRTYRDVTDDLMTIGMPNSAADAV